MEEKELMHDLHEVFTLTTTILENIKKGFLTHNAALLKENKKKLNDIIKSRVSFAEKIIEEKNKTEIDKKYVNMLPSFQTVALAIENLISKMETKVELKILFSEKALAEINQLFGIAQSQFINTKDYILTKNPSLKNSISSDKEKLIQLAAEYDLVHQSRLITGVCMPKASYLYIDITDSLKRIARGLTDFSSKV